MDGSNESNTENLNNENSKSIDIATSIVSSNFACEDDSVNLGVEEDINDTDFDDAYNFLFVEFLKLKKYDIKLVKKCKSLMNEDAKSSLLLNMTLKKLKNWK